MKALWLYVLFASLYILASPGVLNNPDSATRFFTAVSLARHGSVELTDFNDVDLSTYETARAADGQWVELFTEGQSLMVAPFLVAVGAHRDRKQLEFFTAAVVFPLISALVLPSFLIFLRLFCADDRVNVAACMLLGLGTFTFVYAYNGHHESQITLFLMWHAYFIIRWLREGRFSDLFWAGFLVGAIVWFRMNLAYYPLISAGWVVFERRRSGTPWGRIAADLAGLTVAACLAFCPQLYFNALKTGSPFQLPFAQAGIRIAWHYEGSLPHGLLVVALSPYKSFFVYNPVALLSLGCLLFLFSSIRRQPWSMLFVYAGVHTLVTLQMIHWTQHGEISWGPRYLTHLSFIMLMPVWYAMQVWRSRLFRVALIVSCLLGMGVQLLGTLYASELDYGAVRMSPAVYGPDADLAWVNVLGYRFDDLRGVVATRGVIVPARFQALPGADRYFVPQWWWVRLLAFDRYGASGVAVKLAVALLIALAGLALWRLWRLNFTEK